MIDNVIQVVFHLCDRHVALKSYVPEQKESIGDVKCMSMKYVYKVVSIRTNGYTHLTLQNRSVTEITLCKTPDAMKWNLLLT